MLMNQFIHLHEHQEAIFSIQLLSSVSERWHTNNSCFRIRFLIQKRFVAHKYRTGIHTYEVNMWTINWINSWSCLEIQTILTVDWFWNFQYFEWIDFDSDFKSPDQIFSTCFTAEHELHIFNICVLQTDYETVSCNTTAHSPGKMKLQSFPDILIFPLVNLLVIFFEFSIYKARPSPNAPSKLITNERWLWPRNEFL